MSELNRELEFHPLANKYPLVVGQEYENLKLSIKEAGKIRVPIVIFEGKILDGRNRYRAAKDVGVQIATREYDPVEDGDDPEKFVCEMNDDRRHEQLSIVRERQSAIRAERIKRVAEARREGKSTRQIAEEEGVSHTQVQMDIRDATGNDFPVDPNGGVVVGKDGKKRSAVAKKKNCHQEPVCDELESDRGCSTEQWCSVEHPSGERGVSENMLDGIGLPITDESAIEEFAGIEFYDKLDEILSQAAKLIETIAEDQSGKQLLMNSLVSIKRVGGGQSVKEKTVCEKLESLRRDFKHWKPYVAGCPACDNKFNECKMCRGLPYITKSSWTFLSEEKKKRFIEKRKGSR